MRREFLKEKYDEELDDYKEMLSGLAAHTDYSEIINKLTDFRARAFEVFADYPQTLRDIFEETDAMILDAAEKRADKLTDVDTDVIEKLRRGRYDEYGLF